MNRKLLKENAKTALKNNFWVAVLVVLVGSFLGSNWTGLMNTGGGSYSSVPASGGSVKETLTEIQEEINSSATSEFNYSYDDTQSEAENIQEFCSEVFDYMDIDEDTFWGIITAFSIGILVVVIIASIIVFCIQFVIGTFLCAPIGIGVNLFFMKNRKAEGRFSNVFDAFGAGKYMNRVKAMFSSNIRIWAWSLLFYFPGMVKHYQYYFMSYIMAENPNISPERAREISTKMSDGQKWNIFVLELSFIGWIILYTIVMIFLTIISCGLLTLPSLLLAYPLNAYQEATYAELYTERREYALLSGVASADELIGF